MIMRIQELLRKIHISWIRFFCRNSEWKNYTPAQKELFGEIQAGDIIDAWMPLPVSKLSEIEESHRHRPYYAVFKTKDAVIAYKGTSRERADCEEIRVKISADYYNVWKSGFVCLDQLSVIPVNCLISKLDTLSEHTMEQINRKILIQQHNGKLKSARLFPAAACYRRGDVFRNDGRLYYINRIDEHIHAYPLKVSVLQNDLHPSLINTRTSVLFETDIPFTAVMACGGTLHHALKQTETVRKKTQHHVQSMVQGHYYRYSVGQVLEQKWSRQKFIYLFSRNGSDYGIFENSMYEDSMLVQKADSAFFDETEQLADDDTVSYVLNRLIDCNHRQWGWLEELMITA